MGLAPDIDVTPELAYKTPYATSPLLPLLLLSLASQKHAPKAKTSFSDEYDFIVVGAGAAGSVVASRLSELPCVNVLLLEAGPLPPRLTEIPAIATSFFQSPIDWKYWTAPQKYSAFGYEEQKVYWPSGKTVGGSSVWNAMLYIRGNRRNYDEWAAKGAKGWSYEDVLPYFKKLEDNTDPVYLQNAAFHSSGGPITASRPYYNPVKKLASMSAIRDEGYQFVDPNAYEEKGFYDLQGTIRRGQRCSTAKGYLVPTENRTNLDIVPNAMVKKVLIENKQAVGVIFDFKGSTHTVRARNEVILSAGTSNTAQLLMLSGIGPMATLQKFGIPIEVDLPVGMFLKDHPIFGIPYAVDKSLPIFNEEIRNNKNILDYIHFREGPLTSCEGIQIHSFLNNPNSNDDETLEYSVYFSDTASSGATNSGLKPEILAALSTLPKNNIECNVQLLNPRSTGSVSLRSADPYDPPIIDPNYYSDYRDVKNMGDGIKTCQRIMSSPALKAIGATPPKTILPGCEMFIDDMDLYFSCAARALVRTTNHQIGTAKMGDPADPNTVVDPQLRVKGIRGLRVVDASIMPTIPWSNTYIPTVMVAEKGSDIIKETIECC